MNALATSNNQIEQRIAKAYPAHIAPIADAKRLTLLRELVYPWWPERKREAAIHILATAQGYQRIYQTLADTLCPEGTLGSLLQRHIAKALPELSAQDVETAACSYLANRRDDLLSISAAMHPQGPLIQEAIALSEAIRRGEINPDHFFAPIEQASAPPNVSAKITRIHNYANHAFSLAGNDSAAHALAYTVGHSALHAHIASCFQQNGAAARVIAHKLHHTLPDVPMQTALVVANHYCAERMQLALIDVDTLRLPSSGKGYRPHHHPRPQTHIQSDTIQEHDIIEAMVHALMHIH